MMSCKQSFSVLLSVDGTLDRGGFHGPGEGEEGSNGGRKREEVQADAEAQRALRKEEKDVNGDEENEGI